MIPVRCPMLRVWKDHTCRSLGLEGIDLSQMWDGCSLFQRWFDGLEGLKLGNLHKERCEQPWIIRKGITSQTDYRLIEKSIKL